MARRLSDILNSTRKQYFVGREKELQLFRSILVQPELSTYLLSIYGPGGQGKSSLVRAFTETCKELSIPFQILDARDISPTPDHFQKALHQLLQHSTDLFETLQKLDSKFVLLIDTYELLNPIDNWLRTVFLPQMPDNVITVLAGRKAPSQEWTADPGWQQLMKVIHLRNLSRLESKQYLVKRNIAKSELDKILEFTHGHPLALSVVADLLDQFPDRTFNPEESPDIVRSLLDRFVQKAPSPAHRLALEICAIANITTESLLQQVMEVENATELFQWLHDRSFIESNQSGLYPHDSAREALCTDLTWRNPDWNKELHKRIRFYYKQKLKSASKENKRSILYLLAYSHRNHPMVKPYLQWQEGTANWIDQLKETDIPILQEMVERHEGKQSAAIFSYWIKHKASTVWVIKSDLEKPSGFMMGLNLMEINKEEPHPDPAIKSLQKYTAEHSALRREDLVTVFRFWMADKTYQQVSRIQSSVFLTLTQYYFTHNLALHFLCCQNPEFWKSFLSFADLHHKPELDYEMSGKPYGFYMHDWRQVPPEAWLELLGNREDHEKKETYFEAPKMQMIILSEEEFATNVYEALKEYQSDKKLSQNPLIRSKLIISNADGHDDMPILVATLRDCIAEACDSMKESPKEEKFFKVIFRTFINPVGSQESAADYLNIPFSTYRRHLKKAVNLIVEYLWHKEIEK